MTCNTWMVHRDKKIYGDDAEAFRLERWLGDGGDSGRLFDKYNMAFGFGTRSCLGKDLAVMELLKTPLVVCIVIWFKDPVETYNWHFCRTFTPKLCESTSDTPGPEKLLVKGGVAFWKDIWLTIEKRIPVA